MREHIEQARKRSVDWNDVRRRRVWARVDANIQTEPVRRPRTLIWATSLAGLAVVGLGLFVFLRQQGTNHTARSRKYGTLTLRDGSRIELGPHGQVAILEQKPALVRIRQTAGTVVYRVRHDEHRRFSVSAGDVTILDKGTVFTVSMRPSGKVLVSVSHGLVEVRAPGLRADVPAGSNLEVPARRPGSRRHREKERETVAKSGSEDAGLQAEVETRERNRSKRAQRTLPTRARAPRPRNKSTSPTPSTATELLAAADRARRQAHYKEAISLLRRIAREHPSDPRIPSVYFTLGRLLRARGRASAAAKAFAACRRKAPHGPLAEDALAAEAMAWFAAKRHARAKDLARRYLSSYPRGPHAARLKRILAP